jgi:hypothetical protein
MAPDVDDLRVEAATGETPTCYCVNGRPARRATSSRLRGPRLGVHIPSIPLIGDEPA